MTANAKWSLLRRCNEEVMIAKQRDRGANRKKPLLSVDHFIASLSDIHDV